MTALIIVLAVLAAIYLIPLKLLAEYSGEGPRVTAQLGPVRLALYPRPEKPEKKPKKSKKEKKTEKSRNSEQHEKSHGSRGGKLSFFRQLISMGLEALGKLRRRLRMEELTLHMTVGAANADPADAALLYGRAWAALGAMIPMLERVLVVKKRDISVELSGEAEETVIYAYGVIRILLGQLLGLGIRYGAKALKLFLQYKMKGGKQHGTSNQ